MPISFESISPDTLVPFFHAEVTTYAQPISPALRILLIGYKNNEDYSPGTAESEVAYILSDTNVKELFGSGSMLADQYRLCRQNAPYTEIWGMAMNEREGAVRAWAQMRVVNEATRNRNGVMRFYIGGKLVRVTVEYNDSREAIRDKMVRAINRQQNLNCVASKRHPITNDLDPSGTRVYLKCKWSGLTGNEIVISYYSPRGVKDRLAVQLTDINRQFASGEGEAALNPIFDTIGDMEFDIFVSPFSSNNRMDNMTAFMDHVSGRWSSTKQLYGHWVAAKRTSYENLISWADGRNDPHVSVIGYTGSIQPTWEWSAALAGVMATHWIAPPELSRPLQTLELVGIYASWMDDKIPNVTERQSLLARGVSTFTVDNDGTVRVERVRTLRKYSPVGELDPSWADAITMFQAQYFTRFLRRAVSAAFPRSALSNESLAINGFASPDQIREVILSAYSDLVDVGLVENAGLFERALVVERNATDRNRVDCYVTPDFVNQLRVVAVLVETHLELLEEGQLQVA